jgi:hypothetical protein
MRFRWILIAGILGCFILLSGNKTMEASMLESSAENSNYSKETNSDNTSPNSIDELDAMIVACTALAPIKDGDDFQKLTIENRIFLPLYDVAGTVIAYYLEFEDVGYAVINNNRDNPAVIEFGEKYNPLIHDLISKKSSAKIVYNNPFSVFTDDMAERAVTYTYAQLNGDLSRRNSELAEMVSERRQVILEQNTRDDWRNDWGVYYIPSYDSEGTGKKLMYVDGQEWMTDGIYYNATGSDTPVCGAVAGTNLALIFSAMGYNRLNNGSPLQTFYGVANHVPIGTTLFTASSIHSYFASKQYNLNYYVYNILNYSTSSLYNKVKSATNSNHPTIISVWNNDEMEGHWMVSLGWREYGTSYKYIHVLNGWDDSENYFFRINSIPLQSVTEYFVADYNNDSGAFVTRLYNFCLSRTPDTAGLINWVAALLNRTGGGAVAHGFFFSQEYINQGNSDAEYVTDLYYAMLNRAPDTNGYNSWINALNNGHTQQQVFNGFKNSVEFAQLCSYYGIGQ